jgi:hypothetical protein
LHSLSQAVQAIDLSAGAMTILIRHLPTLIAACCAAARLIASGTERGAAEPL